ncbi:hypothetical protein WKH56_20765 [Priestia sp. SB1]|uniref:hypothetical protein n=1 Tax=Priestia sp. SB1 TaxID=3132359 RepID=UPI00317F590A
MTKVFKFQDEEECKCPTCELANEYYVNMLNSEDKEELYHWVVELVEEAQKLGFKDALIRDIALKADILDDLESDCCCEECCDEECNLD